MNFLDHVVATEADAIKALALVKAGVAVSKAQMVVVTAWCAWEVENQKDAVSALVPGAAAQAIQQDLANAQTALNAASDNSLSAQERYVAVKKAQVAVATLALATVGS